MRSILNPAGYFPYTSVHQANTTVSRPLDYKHLLATFRYEHGVQLFLQSEAGTAFIGNTSPQRDVLGGAAIPNFTSLASPLAVVCQPGLLRIFACN